MSIRRPIAGWVIGALGLLAVVMGIFGVVDPSAQARMMGLSSFDSTPTDAHTAALLAIVSLSAINTGTVYLVAAVKQWAGFAVWAVIARSIMACGLLALTLCGHAPHAFVGAAAWEWLGAVMIGVSNRWDRCSMRAHA